MVDSVRFYLCGRCRCQVMICRHCDHGNRYCSDACSQIMKKQSGRTASKNYQDTFIGKLNHAARQRKYRSKKRKVTHEGSTGIFAHGSLVPGENNVDSAPDDEVAVTVEVITQGEVDHRVVCCHFCKRPVSALIRLGFLRCSFSAVSNQQTMWPP